MQDTDLFSTPSIPSEPDEIWARAKADIKSRLDSNVFTYFEGLRLIGMESGKFVFETDMFAQVVVSQNYADTVRDALFRAAGRSIDFEIRAQEPETPPAETEHPRSASTSTEKAVSPAAPPAILSYYTFETFVRGPENEMALSASLGIAENLTDPNTQNPLFIYGPSGVGKTHLLHAIANRAFKNNPLAKICYITCEDFTNEYTASLRASGSQENFRRRFREQDLLLVDDIQFLKGKAGIQEAFFHMFNTLSVHGRKIVLTSDRPASAIGIEDRLVSRFQQGISADIDPPCLETRIAILREKARACNFNFDNFPGTLDFISQNITRNVRNLEGSVNTLSQYVLIKKCSVLPPKLLETLLGCFLAQEGKIQITADLIQRETAEFFKIDIEKMKDKGRMARIVFPRQVAMYLCRELTDMKLKEIGEAFGGRDHGTVLHACKTVQNRIDTDAKDKRDVENLREKISSEHS